MPYNVITTELHYVTLYPMWLLTSSISNDTCHACVPREIQLNVLLRVGNKRAPRIIFFTFDSKKIHQLKWESLTYARHDMVKLMPCSRRDSLPAQAYHSRCTENYQVRPESLQTFQPSYASSKVKNENDAIRNRISDFAKATYFSTKNPINKLAMNNRRLLMAAEFHFVHSVENDS